MGNPENFPSEPGGQESLSEAESIRHAAKEIPEFERVLETLSDEEVVMLDGHMRITGMGERDTLKGFPALYERAKGNLNIPWDSFGTLVHDWKEAKPDPNPTRSNVATEERSLFRKRSEIAKKLAIMIENG
jgi:hypothetical protein